MRDQATFRSAVCKCAGVLLLTAPVGACAQADSGTGGGPTTAESSADWRPRMEARLQQLEKENADLRGKVDRVVATQQAVIKDAQERGMLTLEAGVPRLT